MTRHLSRVLAVTALAALAACSGGGGTLPRPAAPAASAAPLAGNGTATLSFKRLVTTVDTQSAARRTAELSATANSIVIHATQSGAAAYDAVYDISGAAIGNGLTCTTDVSSIYQTCATQVRLPLGNDTLTVSTNSNRDGSGTTLGSATLTVTILDGQNNAIAITLNGAVASMKLFVSDPSPNRGTNVNLPLTVQLYDASGTVLIAPQTYTQPVSITDQDTTTASTLFTQATQNSTQRYNGTSPANTSPSPSAKTVSVPDRYTVPYFVYTGAATPATFTVTATFGTLTSSVTITPVTAASRPAGTTTATHPFSSIRSYDPIYDKSGNLWITQTGGKFALVNTSAGTYTVDANNTFSLSTASVTRTLRAPILGPDGAFYCNSATVSNGVATAPYYVTRFDPVTHVFTDYPAADSVLHITAISGRLVGAERNSKLVWTLPFNGTTAGTASEFPVMPPPVTDTTPVLVPLPTRVFPSSDGNLWVAQTSYATVNGTWLSKYSTTGTKISDVMVDPTRPSHNYDAQAIDTNGAIWFLDIENSNEFVRVDTANANALTRYAVPRVFGQNSLSEVSVYTRLDASNNLYFISYLDNRIGRIDAATSRIDLLPGSPTGGNLYSLATMPDGNLIIAGYGSAPYLYTINTH